MFNYNVIIRNSNDDKLLIYKRGDIIFEQETDKPFDLIQKLSKMTFDNPLKTEVKEFRKTPFRGYLKRLFNYGGKIEIEIQRI